MGDILLEVCVDDVEGLFRAVDGGADRIELCSALDVGGLTPSAGLMAIAAELPVPVYAMIRPRSGNFQYSEAELEQMKRDIDQAGSTGLAGVVLGASDAGNRLDGDAMKPLMEQAGALGKTLHRAIDLVEDYNEAVEIAVELGFERILTSGGAVSALEGLGRIADMRKIAANRLSIMPGCGINAEVAMEIIAATGVKEVHSSCARDEPAPDDGSVQLGFSGSKVRKTNQSKVAALKRAISR